MLDLIAPRRIDGVSLGDLDDLLLEALVGYTIRFSDVFPELLFGKAVLLEKKKTGQDGRKMPSLSYRQETGTSPPLPEQAGGVALDHMVALCCFPHRFSGYR